MITTRNLSKRHGAKTVLRDVSLQFPEKKLTSLIGPNGAGKTTLLMMMARLLEPTQGGIFIGDRSVAGMPRAHYARRVATLRQSPDFNLRLTVEDLVAFGRFPYSRGALTPQDRQAIDEAIAFLSLEPLRCAYLDELSGGQRQMAFMAMTIAQQTDCLLLDEPLNNLDIRHAVQIMRALRRLCDDHGRPPGGAARRHQQPDEQGLLGHAAAFESGAGRAPHVHVVGVDGLLSSGSARNTSAAMMSDMPASASASASASGGSWIQNALRVRQAKPSPQTHGVVEICTCRDHGADSAMP